MSYDFNTRAHTQWFVTPICVTWIIHMWHDSFTSVAQVWLDDELQLQRCFVTHLCVTKLFIRDMTQLQVPRKYHSMMSYDFNGGPWLIYVWHGVFIRDMTHLQVPRKYDAIMSYDINSGSWLIYVWHGVFIRDMTHSQEPRKYDAMMRYEFNSGSWLTHVCHDSFIPDMIRSKCHANMMRWWSTTSIVGRDWHDSHTRHVTHSQVPREYDLMTNPDFSRFIVKSYTIRSEDTTILSKEMYIFQKETHV